MTAVRLPAGPRRRHENTPDTAPLFARLSGLPAGPRREALVDELVRAWLPLAHRLARRFRDRGETLEDLRQVAALGLVRAVERFDPARGSTFEQYAVPTIVGEIKRHFRDHTWDVHVPRRVQELRRRVRTALGELAVSVDDRVPDVARIARQAGISEDEVVTGLGAMGSFRVLSLEAAVGSPGQDEHYTLADTLGEPEHRYDVVLARVAVQPHLAGLPERERRVLAMRFFHGMTQARIGAELGLSQMQVSRLLSRSCARIRAAVESPAADVPAAA
ncbi:SigB/SigF/SigG family RNA polymerase sigma factor [Streptomyces sp. TR02-1]|uniref:SigB/SigF/SigG family RNA polymerase sigma factor n=1 Tax=Streptomyces sp. TR02-1 TaxID=3385977 RepID=UPI0039A27F2A